ncbi:MAG TPA: hypothetical protein PK264_02670, partial [Hyphomicrobiaceae bacterium]|nr:hypothetical protein [Hyphomicrobiaceae bacterium]
MLGAPDIAARDLLGGAEINHGAGGARRAEGKTQELESCRGLLCRVADDVERKCLRLGIVVVRQDLETVADGADRSDHIMADLAGNQRGKFQI